MNAEQLGVFIGKNILNLILLIMGIYWGYGLLFKKKRKEVTKDGMATQDIRDKRETS